MFIKAVTAYNWAPPLLLSAPLVVYNQDDTAETYRFKYQFRKNLFDKRVVPVDKNTCFFLLILQNMLCFVSVLSNKDYHYHMFTAFWNEYFFQNFHNGSNVVDRGSSVRVKRDVLLV